MVLEIFTFQAQAGSKGLKFGAAKRMHEGLAAQHNTSLPIVLRNLSSYKMDMLTIFLYISRF